MLNEIEGFTDKGGFGSDFRGGCKNGADEIGDGTANCSKTGWYKV